MQPQDTITIAPSVLITIARQAALDTAGVARMGNIPVELGRLLRSQPMGTGVVMDLHDEQVKADLYIVVKPGVNMRAVGEAVQVAVKRAIEDLVGMQVTSVLVHIEDVDYPMPD